MVHHGIPVVYHGIPVVYHDVTMVVFFAGLPRYVVYGFSVASLVDSRITDALWPPDTENGAQLFTVESINRFRHCISESPCAHVVA